jgi:hypothetical protein
VDTALSCALSPEGPSAKLKTARAIWPAITDSTTTLWPSSSPEQKPLSEHLLPMTVGLQSPLKSVAFLGEKMSHRGLSQMSLKRVLSSSALSTPG